MENLWLKDYWGCTLFCNRCCIGALFASYRCNFLGFFLVFLNWTASVLYIRKGNRGNLGIISIFLHKTYIMTSIRGQEEVKHDFVEK